MVGDNEQAFLTQTQPLTFLRCRHHFKSLTSTYHMGQQSVSAIEDMSDGVHLVGSQGNLRIHSHKIQVTSIVFPGPNTVECIIVEPCQPLPALWIFPYPVLKFLLNQFLLALSNGRFFLVQDGGFYSIFIGHIIKNPYIAQIQSFLYDSIAMDAICSIGSLGFDILFVVGFAFNVPFIAMFGVMHMNIPLIAFGRIEQLKHKLLYNLWRNPGGSQSHGNLTGSQVYRLHLFQGVHIDSIVLWVLFSVPPCPFQLFPHVTGKVFICGEILFLSAVAIPMHRVSENYAGQIGIYFLLGLAR